MLLYHRLRAAYLTAILPFVCREELHPDFLSDGMQADVPHLHSILNLQSRNCQRRHSQLLDGCAPKCMAADPPRLPLMAIFYIAMADPRRDFSIFSYASLGRCLSFITSLSRPSSPLPRSNNFQGAFRSRLTLLLSLLDAVKPRPAFLPDSNIPTVRQRRRITNFRSNSNETSSNLLPYAAR